MSGDTAERDEQRDIGRLLQSTEDTAAAVRDLSAAQRDDSGRLARVELGQDAQTAALRDLRGSIDGLRVSVEGLRVESIRAVADVRLSASEAKAAAARAHECIDLLAMDVGTARAELREVRSWQTAADGRREGVVRLGSGARGLLQGAAAGATAAAAIVGGVLWALARV